MQFHLSSHAHQPLTIHRPEASEAIQEPAIRVWMGLMHHKRDMCITARALGHAINTYKPLKIDPQRPGSRALCSKELNEVTRCEDGREMCVACMGIRALDLSKKKRRNNCVRLQLTGFRLSHKRRCLRRNEHGSSGGTRRRLCWSHAAWWRPHPGWTCLGGIEHGENPRLLLSHVAQKVRCRLHDECKMQGFLDVRRTRFVGMHAWFGWSPGGHRNETRRHITEPRGFQKAPGTAGYHDAG